MLKANFLINTQTLLIQGALSVAWQVVILYTSGAGSYPLIGDIVRLLAVVGYHVTQGDILVEEPA